MQWPDFLISVNALLCERVLVEKDNVLSAIRIVDTFLLQSPPPPELSNVKQGDPPPSGATVISAYAIVNFKAIPGYRQNHKFAVKLLNTRNEWVDLVPSVDQPFEAGIAGSPSAAGFIAHINLLARNLGVCYVCVYLDDQEITKTPITIALAPRQA